MQFLRRRKVQSLKTRPEVIGLYRNCLRIIQQLEEKHQKTWYDYLRLKYEENANVKDEKRIVFLLKQAREEIDWVQSILDRKK